MNDLHERILAAIGERERLAGEACAGGWHAISPSAPRTRHNDVFHDAAWNVMHEDPRNPNIQLNVCGPLHRGDARHIAANDPATVLRECAAWRRIVERHEFGIKDYGGETDGYPWCFRCANHYPCPDIRDVAEALGVEVE